jgi:hypothetical protein
MMHNEFIIQVKSFAREVGLRDISAPKIKQRRNAVFRQNYRAQGGSGGARHVTMVRRKFRLNEQSEFIMHYERSLSNKTVE